MERVPRSLDRAEDATRGAAPTRRVLSYHDEIWASVPEDRPQDTVGIHCAHRAVLMTRLPARVLDLGCGDGFVTGTLARHSGVQITGLDPSATALERARAKHPDLQFVEPAEDGSLPFPDGSFDVVVCINVLQHVADTQRFMSEARRVLVPSGLIAITVPVHGRLAYLFRFERIHDPLEPTLRFYTRRSLAELLEQFGYGDVVFERGRWPFLRRTLCARARR